MEARSEPDAPDALADLHPHDTGLDAEGSGPPPCDTFPCESRAEGIATLNPTQLEDRLITTGWLGGPHRRGHLPLRRRSPPREGTPHRGSRRHGRRRAHTAVRAWKTVLLRWGRWGDRQVQPVDGQLLGGAGRRRALTLRSRTPGGDAHPTRCVRASRTEGYSAPSH